MSVQRYMAKHRPTVEALQWKGSNADEMEKFIGSAMKHLAAQVADEGKRTFHLDTLYGLQEVKPGDYVIRMTKRLTVRPAEDFHLIYEPISGGLD